MTLLHVNIDLDLGCERCPFEYDGIACRLWRELYPDAEDEPGALSPTEDDPAPSWCPLWDNQVIIEGDGGAEEAT